MREAFSLANEEADSLLPHFPKGSSLTICIKINKNKTQYMEDLPEIPAGHAYWINPVVHLRLD